MNKALLSIGTNTDREENLSLSHELLNSKFSEISYSKTSVTSPYGDNYKNDFLNQLAVIYTNMTKESVIELLKGIERKLGREASDKKNGIVKIDIDLVIWNDDILKPNEINRRYIADLLTDFE